MWLGGPTGECAGVILEMGDLDLDRDLDLDLDESVWPILTFSELDLLISNCSCFDLKSFGNKGEEFLLYSSDFKVLLKPSEFLSAVLKPFLLSFSAILIISL